MIDILPKFYNVEDAVLLNAHLKDIKYLLDVINCSIPEQIINELSKIQLASSPGKLLWMWSTPSTYSVLTSKFKSVLGGVSMRRVNSSYTLLYG